AVWTVATRTPPSSAGRILGDCRRLRPETPAAQHLVARVLAPEMAPEQRDRGHGHLRPRKRRSLIGDADGDGASRSRDRDMRSGGPRLRFEEIAEGVADQRREPDERSGQVVQTDPHDPRLPPLREPPEAADEGHERGGIGRRGGESIFDSGHRVGIDPSEERQGEMVVLGWYPSETVDRTKRAAEILHRGARRVGELDPDEEALLR